MGGKPVVTLPEDELLVDADAIKEKEKIRRRVEERVEEKVEERARERERERENGEQYL